MNDRGRPLTDVERASAYWVVAGDYALTDAIDRFDESGRGWLSLRGEPVWQQHDAAAGLGAVVRDDRALPLATRWVRLIRDTSPISPGPAPRFWVPGERPGLADELVELGTRDEAAILAWVQQYGFVGVRANPAEWRESVEEIREALARLGQARALVSAIRTLKGKALRSEVERLLSLRPGFFAQMQADPTQPMSGMALVRQIGIEVPRGEHWPEAGAHLQALYGLTSVLQEPVRRLLRVDVTIVPTGDGMRLQGALVAIGPLASAYLQTLEEASWPAITYAGSVLRLDWRASRRCARCGRTFKPKRRDQKWCTDRCRWAASKGRAR
jgi:hypothetical protein